MTTNIIKYSEFYLAATLKFWNIQALSIISDQRVTPYAKRWEATVQIYYVTVENFNMRQFPNWQISMILEKRDTRQVVQSTDSDTFTLITWLFFPKNDIHQHVKF